MLFRSGKCRRVINNELDRLAQSLISESVFEKMKRQYCGQLLVSSDNRENRAMSLGKSILYYNEIHDISTTAERMMAVCREEVREVAELLVPSNCGCLTLI